jgi:hypothetical protein
MNTARTHLLTGTLCVLGALLAGCSAGSGNGLGDAGKQSSNDPQAVITSVGHVPAADGSLRVRSGAEVVLSSKDSNGVDSAVLGVSWEPANSAAEAVKMLERGASAMSFRAPVPEDDTALELRFRLTIRTADGDSGSSEIRVLVDRVPDPDDFLLTDLTTSAESVNLAVVAAGYQTVAISQNIPFQLQIQKQVRYKRAIEAGPNPSASPAADDPVYCASTDTKLCVKIGAASTLTGTWMRDAGVEGLLNSSGALQADVVAGSFRNPRFRLRLPSLNADEVNFAVLSGGITNNATGVPAGDARRNNQLYAVDMDDAQAEYVITLAPDPGVAASLGTRTLLLVYAADSTLSPNPLKLVGGNLTPGVGGVATATITRDVALANARSSGVVESAATAAAYYEAIDPAPSKRDTLRKWLLDNCFQPELAGRPGNYGADIHSTYLNDRDLGFGREMYFKTTCTSAQLSATGASINTTAGERASIVFNYPSLEAAIKRTNSFLAVAMEYRADAGGGPKYTRFYTFAPDPRDGSWKRVLSANFDGRGERYTPGNCTICHGGKPKATYAAVGAGGDVGATFVPWDANALLFADTDPSILDGRIRQGFTRAEQLPNIQALNMQGVLPIINSRIPDTPLATQPRWEAMRTLIESWYPTGSPANYAKVPDSWTGGTSAGSTSLSSETLYGTVIAENCRMCHLQRITKPDAATGLLTDDSAPQFNAFADRFISGNDKSTLAQRVFEQHVMPASRLTSDRFWIAQSGSNQSAAQVLAAHLGLTLPAAKPRLKAAGVLTNATQALIDPNNPAANLSVRLTGLGSQFASSYVWTFSKPLGSEAVLVGGNTAEPALRADRSGTYSLGLTVRDAAGHEDILATPVTFVVDRKPIGGDYSILTYGTTLDVFAEGGSRPGDGLNTITLLPPIPAGITVTALPGSCENICQIVFTATSSGDLRYRITDGDSPAAERDFADGRIRITVPARWNLTPPPALSCVAPCSSYNIGYDPTAAARTALGRDLASNETVTVCVYRNGACDGARQTDQQGRAATRGTVTFTATSVTYAAPAFFVSDQGSGSVADTFPLKIFVNGPSGLMLQSEIGTFQVTVTPRSRWGASAPSGTGVLALLQSSSCNAGGCHAGLPDSTRAWGQLKTLDSSNNPTTTNSTGNETYNQLAGTLRASCPAGETGSPPKCVDFSNALNSLLLHKPLGEYFHYYGPGTIPTCSQQASDIACGYPAGLTTPQLDQIRDWILDGAYKN